MDAFKIKKGIEKEDIRFQLEELESMRNDGRNEK